MKHIRNTLSIFFLSIAACLVVGCGGPAERIRETSARTPTPAPPPAEREISGQFSVSGADTNDTNAYTGLLTISPQGDVYGFRWTLNSGSRVGSGVQFGSAVAASFAPTGGGRGCGVVLYKIASDGSLDGRTAGWGEEKFGTEKAVRTEGRGFVGNYSVTGSTADGETYTATLTIKKDGAGYDLEWKGSRSQVAFGTWQGNVAAASFGGRQCSFALYDIQSNGNLEGHWGGQRSVTIGTETAKRQ